MSKIEQKVMAAVFVIRGARIVTSASALKLYAIILSVWGISRIVWVSKVFENFATANQAGIDAAFNYVLSAIEHTHLGVQVMLLIVTFAFISLLTDTLRAAPRSARFAA